MNISWCDGHDGPSGECPKPKRGDLLPCYLERCADCSYLDLGIGIDNREHCGTCSCCPPNGKQFKYMEAHELPNEDESRDPFDPVEPYDGK